MSQNRWGLPDLGLGVGLRTSHFNHILEHKPDVDWFEIISENFIDTEGRPLWVLDQVAERYPVVMHGVSLSIGSTDIIDFEYLKKLKKLADRIQTPWMGDHVCWTGVNGLNGHDLFPIPFTEESLGHVVSRIKIVQEVLERPLVLENPSTYIEFKESTMSEETFIARMAEDADCALLLDVNNVYVNHRNHGISAEGYLEKIPYDRVVQIHLAGHTDNKTHCIDTHNDHVIDEVWRLYARVQELAGSRATLLEWDADIPEFEVVHDEVKKAQKFRAQDYRKVLDSRDELGAARD